MKKVEIINGKYMLNCVILVDGEIPAFGGIRGPLTIPRPMEVDVVKTLLFFGADVRVVDGMEYKVEDTEKLTLEKIEELISGKKPEPQQVREESKVEQPPVEEVKEEVKEQPVVKEEPKVEQPPVEEVKEEVKPAQNNKKSKK